VDTGKLGRGRLRAAPRPGLRLGLTLIKAAVLGALLTVLAVAGGLPTASPDETGTASVDDAYQRVVERAVTDQRCSSREPNSAARDAAALIRTARGDVRVVSFEKAWDVYNGKRPGDLIAVCVDDRETATHRPPRARNDVTG